MNERFTIVVGPVGLEIADTRERPFKIIAVCTGWSKWEHANLICDALNDFNEPIERLMNEAVKGTKRSTKRSK